ncbi:MAG: hypothetical protein IJQ39_12495 [Thermoguttaceae bacterium]|nr:hypothetical protein [Thermoguttaceae bacterium]
MVVDIASDYGVFVSFSDGLGDKTISGTYKDIGIAELLNSLAVQLGVRYSFDGQIFYLSDSDFSKKFVLVGRSSIPEEQLSNLLVSLIGEKSEAKYFNVGNKFFIYDTSDNLKIYASAIKDFDSLNLRSYVAEVFFIRVSNSDLIDLQAKMDATGIDILKQSWSLKDLFNCYIDADLQHKTQHIIQRPILYCSEGKQATMNVGTDLTLEKKAISTEGYTSTTGWQTFSDGLQISLLIKRVQEGLYQADFDLTISKYDDIGDTVVGVLPKIDKTGLTQSGVMVPASEPILLGSLSTTGKRRGFGFVTANGQKNDESILVFLRVREIDLKTPNLFIFDETAIDGI